MDLTWRDVQHIIVQTAKIPNDEEPGWFLNGAGFHVNDKFGFGAIDCGMMVEMAQDWVSIQDESICHVPADSEEV